MQHTILKIIHLLNEIHASVKPVESGIFRKRRFENRTFSIKIFICNKLFMHARCS